MTFTLTEYRTGCMGHIQQTLTVTHNSEIFIILYIKYADMYNSIHF